MLRIADLRRSFPRPYETLEAQLGKFALIQRPPDPVLRQVAMQLSSARTVTMAHRSRIAEQLMVMLHAFENFLVLGVNAGAEDAEFTVGRLPDSNIVVQDPSASQHHAVLRWSGATREAWVRDLTSTNGTFVNARELYEETALMDGDTLSFGDAHFMFLLTPTVHAQLSNLSAGGGP